MFALDGQSCFMYDFFSILEKSSASKADCSCENVFLRLCEGIPRQQNFKMCFDNWFCTLPLLLKMKSFGTLTTATIRANRFAGCPLKAEKDLKNEGRRSSSVRTDANSELMLLCWLDNKSVQLASTISSAAVSGFVKRWDATSEKYIQIPCPELVNEHSSAMGLLT